ncbi:MAG: Ig-like domain-containing protein, partial [Muricoprocola sp.]
VTFHSSNKKIAVVSKTGVITAKSAGTVKITVKSGKKKVTVKLNVRPKDSTIQNAYTRYMKKLSSYWDSAYYLIDLNNDGIKELIYEYPNGLWCGVRVYTYKNNKVVLLRSWPHGVSQVKLRKGSNTLVLCTGTVNTEYTYEQYRFTGSKLKQTGDVYQMLVDHDTNPWTIRYLKNKKTISESVYSNYIGNELRNISWKYN